MLFTKDVDAIHVLSDMCARVNGVPPGEAITPAGVAACRAAVLQRCEIDIATFLDEQARLGRSYRQILDELRSFNTTVCLRRHFGVSPGSLGAPRRMRTWGPATFRKQSVLPHPILTTNRSGVSRELTNLCFYRLCRLHISNDYYTYPTRKTC